MRAWVIVWITFWPILVSGANPGNDESPFRYYLNMYMADDSMEVSPTRLLGFIDKVAGKRTEFSSETAFLQYVFNKTHAKFLKHYEEYASFVELLSGGRYNCLTGTALYALLLDNLGYRFSIVETNYHIFLLVNTKDGQVLFEATDPQNGFVRDADRIKERISKYRQNLEAQADAGKTYYRYQVNLFRQVTMEQLAGLLYYNQSVKAYNERNLTLSVNWLSLSAPYYKSSRVDEFSSILLMALEVNKADPSSILSGKIKLLIQ